MIIYIASGKDYPDALVASSLCTDADAVLITYPTSIHPTVRTLLQELKPDQIIVVGGTGAISESVFNELKQLAPSVERISGADRYETAAALVKLKKKPTRTIVKSLLANSVVGAVEEPPPPPPPTGGMPPVTTYRYVDVPSISMPGLRQSIIDPNFGTKITRIGDAGMRHSYSRIQPWSPDEKYLFLAKGGSWFLDGMTYAPIKVQHLPYVATWINNTQMIGTRTNKLVLVDVPSGQEQTIRVFPEFGTSATIVTMGEGEGAPSDDFRYWALMGRRLDGRESVFCYDRSTDTIVGEKLFNSHPNNCTMSAKGNYVIVEWSSGGTGEEQGTWLYTRDMVRVRQIWTGTPHMDVGLNAAGEEVACSLGGGSVNYYRLSDGQTYKLVPSATTWSWVGHISLHGPAGWALCSPNDHENLPGNEQLGLLDLSKANATTARIWGHTHQDNPTYEMQPQAVLSPSGTRVLFASNWHSGNTYPFVASMP